MSGKQNKFRDPVKRAAKRARQREAASRSSALPADPKISQSQATHASGPKARKKAREGERRLLTIHDPTATAAGSAPKTSAAEVAAAAPPTKE